MVNSTITAATQNTASTAASTSSSSTSSSSSSTAISADVAAQVKQALAPAAAGAQKITAALTQGQARLSSLGQLKSAIADFQTITQSLSAAATTKADGSAADPTAKLQSFVSAFNTLNTKLQTLQKGDLKSDPGLAQVTAQLAQMLRDTGSGSGAASLAKAGITLDSSGAMKLDSAKLSSALASDPTAANGLFATNGRGIIDQLGSRLGALNTTNGTVGREAATASKQVSLLETKQAALTKTLTSQASALAAFYTQQANSGSSTAPTSLFDMLA